MNAARRAALNITLDSISRRTGRAWQNSERDQATAALNTMADFPLSQAGYVAHQLAGQVVKAVRS